MVSCGWCVLQVRSGTESKVCDMLKSRCSGSVVDVFSPSIGQEGIIKGRKFLPGYIFVKVVSGPGFSADLSKMQNLYGVTCKFLNHAGSPKFLSDDEMREMQEQMSSPEVQQVSDKIVVGSRVSILCEYFESCVGEVDEIDEKSSKAKVKIVFCGQNVLVSFNLDQLKLID